MDRFRILPNYRYYDSADGIIKTAYEKPLRDYKIYGNSVQNGTPSPDNPIEIQSVGDYDEKTGKYKISIEISNENGDTQNYNIFLDEPLRKCGKYIDYIDFKNAKIVRNVIYYNSIVDAKPSAEYQWGWGIQGNYGKTWGTCSIKAAYDAAPMSNRFTGYIGGEAVSYALPYHFQMSTTYKNCYCALPISIFAKHGGLTSEEFMALEKADQTTLINQYMIDNEVDLQGGRNIAIEELIDLHEIKICKGKSIIKVNTKIQPSAVSYQYYA